MSTLREADGDALGDSLHFFVDFETLAAIEQRVLGLAVRIVDYANRERRDTTR